LGQALVFLFGFGGVALLYEKPLFGFYRSEVAMKFRETRDEGNISIIKDFGKFFLFYIKLRIMMNKKKEFNNSNEEVELEGTGENEENELDSHADIRNPFDPKDIKISVEPKSMDSLLIRMRQNAIDLNTEFQRKGNLWNPVTQSRLIESLLLKFPLPVFYFDASNDENWLIVDGLQRLWALKNFVIDKKLTLQGLEILKSYNGATYDSLNLTMQRRINETQVTAYLIQPGSPKKVKYYVFRRINTGGLTLNAQEIRHALNQEQAADFLKNLAESNEFRDNFRVPDKRMQDRELILRGLTFIFKNYVEYEKPLADFLDRSIEEIEKMTSVKLEELGEQFYQGIKRAKLLFGRHVYSRSIVKGYNYRLNAALFEVWTSYLAKLSNDKFGKLVSNRITFLEEYKQLIEDKEFEKAVVSSTSGKQAVTKRFSEIDKLIKKYVK
jgi:hypothetical protein